MATTAAMRRYLRCFIVVSHPFLEVTKCPPAADLSRASNKPTLAEARCP
jgi:hypothetical protein